ncbi:MAG: uroporphyrinogen-III synthase [Candidatus Sericytochromatia bacterium]
MSQPLTGQRVLITRAEGGQDPLAERLRALGAVPVAAPAIRVAPPAAWDAVDRALERLGSFDWLVVTSVNGVRHVSERLAALGLGWPVGLRLAAVGPKTAESAREAGWAPDMIPEKTHGEGLAEALALEAAGRRFLLARGDLASRELPDGLLRAGAVVEEVVVYTNRPDERVAEVAGELAAGRIGWALFASGSAFRHLLAALPDPGVLRGVKLASIGPKTSAVIRQLGFEVAVEATVMTIEGLVEAVAAAETV